MLIEAKDKNHLKHAFMRNTLEHYTYTTVTVFILKSVFLKFIYSLYLFIYSLYIYSL